MAAGEQVTISNISIHSPRMGRDQIEDGIGDGAEISIHSPRMGRDVNAVRQSAAVYDFNPLSPHGERP